LAIASESVDIDVIKDSVTEVQFRLSVFSSKIDKIIYSDAVTKVKQVLQMLIRARDC